MELSSDSENENEIIEILTKKNYKKKTVKIDSEPVQIEKPETDEAPVKKIKKVVKKKIVKKDVEPETDDEPPVKKIKKVVKKVVKKNVEKDVEPETDDEPPVKKIKKVVKKVIEPESESESESESEKPVKKEVIETEQPWKSHRKRNQLLTQQYETVLRFL